MLLIVLLIIKMALELLFMVAIPQMTYSVKINRDGRGEATPKEETNQKTIPLLHLFSNKQLLPSDTLIQKGDFLCSGNINP